MLGKKRRTAHKAGELEDIGLGGDIDADRRSGFFGLYH